MARTGAAAGSGNQQTAIVVGCGVIVILLTCCANPVYSWTPTRTTALKRARMSRSYMTTADDELPSLKCSQHAKDKFKGQRVLLTGASGGLGRSLALHLTTCGVSTLVLSGRNAESLNKVVKECKSMVDPFHSLDVHVLRCDLGDAESVSKLGSDVLDKVGTMDVLINNGGVSSRSRFLDTKYEVDEQVMQINFLAGVRLAKCLVPKMVEQGTGTILWISSIQGLVGIPHRTSYAASKFAVQGYCEALRGELASSGVSVHVASPGYIRTNLSQSAIRGDGEKYGKMDETTANGADPNDVASSILDSVAKGKADFVVASSASAKAAIWLRLLAPSFLNSLLKKRYEKSQLLVVEEENQE